jgi:hypothetical protein
MIKKMFIEQIMSLSACELDKTESFIEGIIAKKEAHENGSQEAEEDGNVKKAGILLIRRRT